jgi:transcriptional regulator with XRE-family HTH domain
MNESRIADLRRNRGWTQEQLAERSTVAVRTIQRLEAGQDASLETLSLLADALGVPVSELFATIERPGFAAAVDGLDERTAAQQARRNAVTRSWNQLCPAVGIVLSITFVALIGAGVFSGPLILIVGAYWAAGRYLFTFIQHAVLDPWLDRKYPLTSPTTAPATTTA